MITLTSEQYKCLRKHLAAIEEIIGLGSTGSVIAPGAKPKETRKDRIERYKSMISTGARGTKPGHLKK